MTIDNFSGEYRFLSNFFPSMIVVQGKFYPTVEHAFQGWKTINPAEKEAIRLAPTPKRAKGLGRRCTLRKDWEDIKLKVMTGLCTRKFIKPDFRAMLLATGDEELIEGNTWGDTYWGECNGIGENHLGIILMQIRSELKEYYDGHSGATP